VFVRACVCVYVYVCERVFVFVFVCVCVCMLVCVSMRVRARTLVYVCLYVRVRVYIHPPYGPPPFSVQENTICPSPLSSPPLFAISRRRVAHSRVRVWCNYKWNHPPPIPPYPCPPPNTQMLFVSLRIMSIGVFNRTIQSNIEHYRAL